MSRVETKKKRPRSLTDDLVRAALMLAVIWAAVFIVMDDDEPEEVRESGIIRLGEPVQRDIAAPAAGTGAAKVNPLASASGEELILETKLLIGELLEFREHPDFTERFGFGSAGPYHKWLTRTEELVAKSKNTAILNADCSRSINSLHQVAETYRTKGQPGKSALDNLQKCLGSP